MALGHSSPSPPTLKSQRRPSEDAILSKVAGPSTIQVVTTPLSPQPMPAYASKWQDAVKSTNRFRESSVLEIERTMKRWFTDARDRGLGRKTARCRRESVMGRRLFVRFTL
nr:unnamed protein product [Fasciola hepatica]